MALSGHQNTLHVAAELPRPFIMLGRVVDDLADLIQAVDEQGFPLVPPDGGELLNGVA